MNYINVHLSMPTSPDDHTLVWVHTLSIPVNSLIPLSLRPFKLLQYICFSLLAAHGELSLSRERPVPLFPYDSTTINIPSGSPGILDIYYHIDAEDQLHSFPLDPEIERLTVTTSDSQNLRHAGFKNIVSERDGNVCLVTGQQRSFCDVAHLIAVRKGDDYIRILTESRSVNHSNPTYIDDINDIRNGLLLLKQIHTELGKTIAFLPLPNEYMTSQDVYNAPPEQSYILHDLELQPLPVRHVLIPHGRLLRIPSESQDWPPVILFDVVYASAVLKTWGAGSHFHDHVKPTWAKKFYGGTPLDTRDGGLSKLQGERSQAAQQRQQQSESREKRHEQRSGQATEPDTLDILLAAQFLVHGDRARTERAHFEDHEFGRSKVQGWLETGFAKSSDPDHDSEEPLQDTLICTR